MDLQNKIHAKLKKILKKLKNYGIIQTYKLEINFCPVQLNVKRGLVEIDSVLKKCLRKIMNKPRKAEIRNIINELVRKKNSNPFFIAEKLVQENELNKSFGFIKTLNGQTPAIALKFKCDFCKKIFVSKQNFIIKKKLHNNDTGCLCEKCGQIFDKNQKFQEHCNEYNKPSLLSLTTKNFQGYLKNEILVDANSDLNGLTENRVEDKVLENLKQTVAEKEVKNSSQADNFKSETRKISEKKLVCSCGKVFQNLKVFKKHEKLKHLAINFKHPCVTCGKSFVDKGKLNRHTLSHNSGQYHCSVCSKQFSRSDTLKRHMSLLHYTPEEFICSYCQKKFKLKYNRDIHEENVHRNANNQVPCQDCGRKFKNKITLKSHLRTHFDNKITCQACCKSFTRKSYYKCHLRSKHFGISPLQEMPGKIHA